MPPEAVAPPSHLLSQPLHQHPAPALPRLLSQLQVTRGLLPEERERGLRDVDPAGQAGGFEPAGGVHGGPEEAVAAPYLTHDAAHHTA